MQKILCTVFALGLSVLSSMEGYEKGYTEAKVNVQPRTVVEYVEVETEPAVEYVEAEVVPIVEEPQMISLGIYEITAYCTCVRCCGKSDGITASGVKATANRTIAADTSILPFGTEIYINGQKYVVEDKGGAIRGNRIDMYFDTHQEALQWGRQHVEIFKEVQ
jgi:3D (Asp-Asp-Asp) domain-containing protein